MTARWGCFWWRLGQQARLVGGKERWRQEVAGVGCRFNCMQCDHVGLISLNAHLSTPGVCIHLLPSQPPLPSPLLPLPSLCSPNGKICIQTCYHQLPVTPLLVDLPQNGAGILVTVQVEKCSLPSSQGRVYGCHKQGRSQFHFECDIALDTAIACTGPANPFPI